MYFRSDWFKERLILLLFWDRALQGNAFLSHEELRDQIESMSIETLAPWLSASPRKVLLKCLYYLPDVTSMLDSIHFKCQVRYVLSALFSTAEFSFGTAFLKKTWDSISVSDLAATRKERLKVASKMTFPNNGDHWWSPKILLSYTGYFSHALGNLLFIQVRLQVLT